MLAGIVCRVLRTCRYVFGHEPQSLWLNSSRRNRVRCVGVSRRRIFPFWRLKAAFVFGWCCFACRGGTRFVSRSRIFIGDNPRLVSAMPMLFAWSRENGRAWMFLGKTSRVDVSLCLLPRRLPNRSICCLGSVRKKEAPRHIGIKMGLPGENTTFASFLVLQYQIGDLPRGSWKKLRKGCIHLNSLTP